MDGVKESTTSPITLPRTRGSDIFDLAILEREMMNNTKKSTESNKEGADRPCSFLVSCYKRHFLYLKMFPTSFNIFTTRFHLQFIFNFSTSYPTINFRVGLECYRVLEFQCGTLRRDLSSHKVQGTVVDLCRSWQVQYEEINQ